METLSTVVWIWAQRKVRKLFCTLNISDLSFTSQWKHSKETTLSWTHLPVYFQSRLQRSNTCRSAIHGCCRWTRVTASSTRRGSSALTATKPWCPCGAPSPSTSLSDLLLCFYTICFIALFGFVNKGMVFASLQNNLDPLPPVMLGCLRADVRIPASTSPRCDEYNSSGNMTHGFLYPPSRHQQPIAALNQSHTFCLPAPQETAITASSSKLAATENDPKITGR